MARIQTAKYRHKCEMCPKTVEKGEEFVVQLYMASGKIIMCIDCYKAAKEEWENKRRIG